MHATHTLLLILPLITPLTTALAIPQPLDALTDPAASLSADSASSFAKRDPARRRKGHRNHPTSDASAGAVAKRSPDSDSEIDVDDIAAAVLAAITEGTDAGSGDASAAAVAKRSPRHRKGTKGRNILSSGVATALAQRDFAPAALEGQDDKYDAAEASAFGKRDSAARRDSVNDVVDAIVAGVTEGTGEGEGGSGSGNAPASAFRKREEVEEDDEREGEGAVAQAMVKREAEAEPEPEAKRRGNAVAAAIAQALGRGGGGNAWANAG